MDLNFIDQAVPSIFINLLNAETQLTEAKVKAIATTTFHLGLALHEARKEFLKEHAETLENTEVKKHNVVSELLQTSETTSSNVTTLESNNIKKLPSFKQISKSECCEPVSQPALQVAAQSQDSTLTIPAVRRRGRPIGSTKKVKS